METGSWADAGGSAEIRGLDDGFDTGFDTGDDGGTQTLPSSSSTAEQILATMRPSSTGSVA